MEEKKYPSTYYINRCKAQQNRQKKIKENEALVKSLSEEKNKLTEELAQYKDMGVFRDEINAVNTAITAIKESLAVLSAKPKVEVKAAPIAVEPDPRVQHYDSRGRTGRLGTIQEEITLSRTQEMPVEAPPSPRIIRTRSNKLFKGFYI